MNAILAGLGTAVPEGRIAQKEAAAVLKPLSCQTAAQERLFETLYRRSGVKARHSVIWNSSAGRPEERQSFYSPAEDGNPSTRQRMAKYEAESDFLAVRAARTALQDADLDPQRVTHLITVSCTGFAAPGFDVTLMKRLGLPAGVARTQVGFMGCQGVMNGMRVMQAMLQADPQACVLLTAVELCSLHYQYGWDTEQVVAGALFADGAAALVGLGGGTAESGQYRLDAHGSTLIEDSGEAMGWHIGDHGFQMTLAPYLPEIIGRKLRPWLEPWLEQQGLSLSQIGSWAVHPGGPRILEAVAAALELDARALETSRQVLAEYGNMSSPTILFVLDRLWQNGAPRPCLMLAFGPGVTIEAALLC